MTSLIILIPRQRRPVARRALIVVVGLVMLSIMGCERTHSSADASGAAASQPAAKEDSTKEEGPSEAGEGVTLTAEQAQKVGVTTTPARAVDYAAETAGYGVVIPHDTIATAVAELTTVKAAQEQSRAAAARAQRLAGTPGAMSADSVETAARQVATDNAAVALAQRRLSSVIGAGAAGGITEGALEDLASGKVKLLRVSFPFGAIQGATPTRLRAQRLDGAAAGAAQAPAGWSTQSIWSAPADASLPGRSFFAQLSGGEIGEGERLLVWVPGTGAAQHGVIVPAQSLVISGSKFWCYVEQKRGVYVRREVATDRPIGTGYFVAQGIAAGDPLVTSAAALLLARELNPVTEAD